MKTAWKPLARKQLNEAFDYLRERNEAAAYRWLDDVTETVELLARMPRIGRRTANPNHEEMRTMNVRSYHVFYAVESDRIVILEVRHVRRKTDPQMIRDAPLVMPPPVARLMR